VEALREVFFLLLRDAGGTVGSRSCFVPHEGKGVPSLGYGKRKRRNIRPKGSRQSLEGNRPNGNRALPSRHSCGESPVRCCVQVRLFLPLPNLVFDGMAKAEIRDALTTLVRKLELDSTDVMWSLHKGVSGGSEKNQREQNLHLHVSYRPRNCEGEKHRISIRREVISLREALGGWLQERGYPIDWKSVSKPGKRRHISPEKIALAQRGEPLHSPEEQLQADLTLAKRLVAKLTREEARRILLELLRSEDAAFSRLEEEISAQDWSISRIRRGKRDTWILKDESGKELALRRILNCKEDEVHRLFMALQARDAEKAPFKRALRNASAAVRRKG
jgi:hypothetical protein